MIARILLLIVAWFAATEGIDGLHLNARYAGDPDNLSIAQAQSPAITLPAFVHITDARLDSSFCLTETTSKGEEEVKKTSLFVPLLDASQSAQLSQGRPVTVNVFAQYDDCSKQHSFDTMQGILRADPSFDTVMRDKLKESGFIVGSNPVVLESEKTPTSELLNVLFLVLSVIMALAAIIPFFKRNKWPKEKELEEMEHPEMLAAMHPGLHVPADLLPSLAAGLPNATDPSQPEVVLLKINCWNNAKHPSFAVVTNKRYLLYRTNLQLGLSILKGIAKLIDKIPVFGSFVSMLVEPFIESYEIVLSPELPRFHKNMDHDHHEILSGNVHWHKHCDVALADIPKMAKALSIKRSGWSGLARVVFLPHSLKGIFATPKDFIIPEYCEFVVLHKLLELFGPTFALHGCTVTKEKHKIEISWPKA